jgi:hypothetical protein
MIFVHEVPNPFEPTCRTTVVDRTAASVADLVPAKWRQTRSVAPYVNGRAARMDTAVGDGDHVTFTLQPHGAEAVLLFSKAFVYLFLAVALNSFRPKLRAASDRNEDRSQHYGFDGIQSTRTEGLPVPRIYGRFRSGGQIVNEFVESKGSLGSWYNVIIDFGWGPYQSIAGITTNTHPSSPRRTRASSANGIPAGLFINDTPASQFDDVELHTRLGTNEQDWIPGFDRDTFTIPIQRDLSAPEGTTTSFDPFISTTAPSTGEDSLWTTYAEEYDVTDREIDAFTIKTRFPAGLYSINTSSNSINTMPFALAVRYRELDGSNLPITTGGLDGDGWVRPLPTRVLYAAEQSDMRVDYTFPTYDPQTWTRPTLNGLLRCSPVDGGIVSAVTGYLTRSAANVASDGVPSGWSEANGIRELTVMGWVALRANGTFHGYSADANQDRLQTAAPVFAWLNESTLRGFELLFQTKTFTLSPGQTRTRITPIARVGDGGTVREFYPRNPGGGAGSTAQEIGDVPILIGLSQFDNLSTAGFYHVGFTYKQDVDGTNDRLRIFINGEVVFELVGPLTIRPPQVASPAAVFVATDGRNTGGEAFTLRGWLAEVSVQPTELSQAEMARRYNNGAGLYEPNDASSFATFHFEENYPSGVQGNGQTILNSGAVLGSLTSIFNGGTASHFSSGVQKGFIDREVATNTPKRAKYRIQVMRATRNYTGSNGSDDCQWEALLTHVEQKYRAPGRVRMGLRVKAQEQLAGSPPKISAVIEGALVRVWDGVDANEPYMPLVFSRNPAWVAYDVCTHPRGGMGAHVSPKDPDLVSLKEWADRNDEWVYDLRGNLLEVDDSDTAKAISDIGYTSLGGLVSSFFVILRSAYIGNIPDNYKVGAFVGFSGIPTPDDSAQILLDINEDSVGGWEIVSVDNGLVSGTPRIYLRYDTLTLPALPWTPSGSLVSSASPLAITGTMRGVERRHRYDGAFDEAEGGWDALISLCDTAGAVPLRSGRKIFFRVDAPRLPTDMITPANILRDSFEYEFTGPDDKPNALDIEILDEEANFERATVSDEHPSITGSVSLSEIRRSSVRLKGVTRRSQAKRWAREALNQNYLIRRAGKHVASADALPHRPGDVLQIAHDIIPRGNGGRVLDGSTSSSILLDRPITLAAATTYKLAVRSATAGVAAAFETRTVTNSAGTYEGLEGEAITVSSAFSFTPAAEDVFILCQVGKELRVTLRSIGLTRDLRREETWVEAPEGIHIEDGSEIDDLPASTLSSSSSAITFGASSDTGQLPDNVDMLPPAERVLRDNAGSFTTGVQLSWVAPTSRAISEQIVWASRERGPWREVARVGPSVATTFVPVPRVEPGASLSFAIQPVTRSGARREPADCGPRSLRLVGVGPAPSAPTGLAASIVSERVVYSWDAVSDDITAIELRRGGWILGQPIATVPRGSNSFGPTSDFVSVPAGEPGALVVMRTRNGAGALSPPVAIRFAPSILDSTTLEDLDASVLASQEWSEFGDGWVDDSFPTQNGTLLDMIRRDDGAIEFDGSSLTGSYTAAAPDLEVGGQAEALYLSATVEAYQVHPMTWDQATWTWADPAAQQLSWEGPVNEIGDGADERCTLAIEVRFRNRARDWSAWTPFKPGRTVALGVQFRLVATRPSASYQIRVTRFATVLVREPTTKFDRDETTVYLERMIHGSR